MPKISLWDRRSWGYLRQCKGLTYRQLAGELNVWHGTVEKWFNGTREPRVSHQIALGKALGIPLRSLLSEIQDPDIKAAIRAAYND